MTKKPDANELMDMLLSNRDEKSPWLRLSAQAGRQLALADTATISNLELTSIYALLAFVADNQNISQETVQAITEARFNVNHISKIKQRDFESAVEFLADIRIDELRH